MLALNEENMDTTAVIRASVFLTSEYNNKFQKHPHPPAHFPTLFANLLNLHSWTRHHVAYLFLANVSGSCITTFIHGFSSSTCVIQPTNQL